MDNAITRRRSSSGPAAIKTCTTLIQPKQDDKPSATLSALEENFPLYGAAVSSGSTSRVSSSASERLNTFSATSQVPHENLTSTTPLTDANLAQNPIFCCTGCTVVHIRDNLPEETVCIEAFVNYAHSHSATVSLRLDPHIITVRYVESTAEPNITKTYDGYVRFFGLSSADTISRKEKTSVVEGAVPPYTEIYPTSLLLQDFRQTGLLGLKCEAHGGMWFEVAVIQDCGGDDDDDDSEVDGDEHGVEEKKEDGEGQELDEAEMDNSTEVAASNGALALESGTSATSTEIVPVEDNTWAAITAAEMATTVLETPKTPAQRKNDKRRTNEETRKKDNQRRMERRKKAAAAKRAAKGGPVAEIMKGETGIEEDNRSVVEKETGSEDDGEGEQSSSWWYCSVM
jgi:hypothetical protein